MTLAASLERLDSFLAIDPKSAQAEVRRRFQAAFRGREGRVVLFGAGWFGQKAARCLRAAGFQVLALTDNNPALHGQERKGLEILAPAEAARRFGDNAVFISTVFTNAPLHRQLDAMGLRHLPYAVLAWEYADFLSPCWPCFFPEGPGDSARLIRSGLAVLAGEASRAEYVGQIGWRSTLDAGLLPGHLPAEETYFAREWVRLSAAETFVDCGAFDGDSLRGFLRHQPAGPEHYLAVEPDAGNRAALTRYLESLAPGLCRAASQFPVVLGRTSGSVSFQQSGGVGSYVQGPEGSCPMESLDRLLREVTPTFIKMDIEGAELEALEGARETLRRCRPVLAVALYHQPAHLWEIPLKLRELAPAHSLHIGRHSDDCWEMVCYAVPPSGEAG